MKKYRIAFYDWDGCIAKTLDVWRDAYRQMFTTEGLHPDDKEIFKLFGNWELPKLLGHSDNDRATKEVVRYVDKHVKYVKLYPHVQKVLAELCGRGIKIAILSSSKRKSIIATEAFQNIADMCQFLVTAEDVTHHKPHPEIIETALSRMGESPSAAVMVGDSDKDIGVAKNAGIDSILYIPEGNKKYFDFDELLSMRPTYHIESHTAALGIIKP